ncbi:hypothetical protein F4604DRAFT_1672625 [Suillus subluteus]|nr:hypothetical protein F4604DRAFT_1672625 [Suillus subluteus]
MSDAQAAQVTEYGVPPAAQEYVIEEVPPFKVFAGNLAYSTTDEGLKTFFAPVQSDIITAQVILRGPRSTGYGFVAMSSAEAAQRAVDLLNLGELDGRKVIVEIAKPADQKDKEKKERRAKRRPNRRGAKAVPGEVTDAEANGEVKAEDAAASTAALGTDEAAKPKRKKKKNSRKSRRRVTPLEGEMLHEEAAPAAEDAPDAAVPAPRKPRVRRPRAPRPPRAVGEDPIGEPSKTTLFVANLGFSVDDETLSALFTEAGVNVVSARVVRRRWGTPRKSKGYGFVDVGTEEEQVKAIEAVQGKEVGGRAIAVKIAVNSARYELADEAELRKFFHGYCIQIALMIPKMNVQSMADEDDYLSDKFLIQVAAEFVPKTYAQRRQEALKQSRVKNEQNRMKSRRQREQESREEGLSKSLFERAQEEEKAVGGSKALGIMMKMGFKVGQSLGKTEDSPPKTTVPLPGPSLSEDESEQGKQGIGLGKRARSPSAADRLAKMAKMAEAASHESFRDRARREYEERRAEGRLSSARQTCLTLDEKADITFNVLCLDPNNPDSIPNGLVDALSTHTLQVSPLRSASGDVSHAARLRAQMVADALLPVTSLDEDEDADDSETPTTVEQFPQEVIEEAVYFLRLGPRDRLKLLLEYLRGKYSYCFWCGTQYGDAIDLEQSCPGPEEDDHD